MTPPKRTYGSPLTSPLIEGVKGGRMPHLVVGEFSSLIFLYALSLFLLQAAIAHVAHSPVGA